jgi:predicted RND superfamily exporter protein
MRWFHRALLRFILLIISRPRRTLMIAGVAVLASAALAMTRLNISTDQNQLFSAKVPFFRNYLDYISRFHENEAVYITIEPKDSSTYPPVNRWTAAADAIDAAERRLPNYVDSVQSHVDVASLGESALLYENPKILPADAKRLAQFVPLAALWAQPSPFTAILGHTPIERTISSAGLQTPPDAMTAQFVGLVARQMAGALTTSSPITLGQQVPDLFTLSATTPASLGYFYVPDASAPANHLLLVEVFPHRDFTSLTAISHAVNAIRDAAHTAGREFPEFDIGVTGRPALEADQMQTTDQDSHYAETAALITVFILLTISLRSIWLALASELSLLAGIGWTFGWATLAVGRLNILSIVFLIALIGIGMDYLVQILSRYRQEAARSHRQTVIWTNVFRHVSLPINTACAGAAGAFLVATLTDFRGAAELGIIAGGGLFLCLVAGYTVLPALLVLAPPRIALIPLAERRREHEARPRAARWRILLLLLWIVPLLLGLPWISKPTFDSNLLKLQAPDVPSVKLIDKLQTWSAVVMSKDLDMLRQVRAAAMSSPLVDHTDSFLDADDNRAYLIRFGATVPGLGSIHWVAPPDATPADLATIATKARALADKFAAQSGPDFALAAKSLTQLAAAVEHPSDPDAVARRLSTWQSIFVNELKSIVGQLTPPPPDITSAPPVLQSHYRSDDGYWSLYLIPKKDLWARNDLDAFERDVESRIAAVPDAPPVTGITSDIDHSTSAIQASFYTSAAYALSLIFLLVLLDLRHLGHTLIAVSVLALGIPMLVELMGRLGINWNFANFFGLPILIGAGHEYGVFMIHRYREALRDRRRGWTRWDASDKALLLCALITSSSFGFFYALAHHRGLKSLGLVMALGTACIYLATILVVRPLLMWLLNRRNKNLATVTTEKELLGREKCVQ